MTRQPSPIGNAAARLTRALAKLRREPAVVRKRLEGLLLGRLLMQRRGAVCMFHTGRAGSSVLSDMLHQHERIHWRGEIYEAPLVDAWRSERGADPSEAERALRKAMATAGRGFFGFEVKFFHLRDLGITLEDYLRLLDRNGTTHYIVLERKNYLRVVVSAAIAEQTAEYHIASGEQPRRRRIRIDPAHVRIERNDRPLVWYLDSYRRGFEELEILLAGRRRLKITYEDDVASDPRVGYRKICDFLAVDAAPVRVRLGRTTPFALSDVIENFDEVRAHLRGTPYAWMLEG